MSIWEKIKGAHWGIALVFMVIGFMMAVQFKANVNTKSLTYQRIEELTTRLVETQKERDDLRRELLETTGEGASALLLALKQKAGMTALEGPGIVLSMNDSAVLAKSGENPNLYIVHDDDILRVINELKAAGAEAIAINGERLTAESEIRCAGPTISVNNVRSGAPFEIRAIGDPNALLSAINMRGGVADTLKVWGIALSVAPSQVVHIPAYKGNLKYEYARIASEKEDEE